MKKLSEKFNTIAVRKGDFFAIELQENGSTGYLWELSAAQGRASFVRSETVTSQTAQKSVGGGYTLRSIWQAQADGIIEMKAELKRPWETGTPPVKTHRFTVICD